MACSRAVLEDWFGHPAHTFAAPHGVVERLLRLATHCGYAIGFTTQSRLPALDDNPLCLRCIEVWGDWRLEAFIGVVRPPR
jgi:hypothetical protein